MNAEKIQVEADRASNLLQAALDELEVENGDIRLFAASLLSTAVRLHIEIEGAEGLKRALSRIASYELAGSGDCGRA